MPDHTKQWIELLRRKIDSLLGSEELPEKPADGQASMADFL